MVRREILAVRQEKGRNGEEGRAHSGEGREIQSFRNDSVVNGTFQVKRASPPLTADVGAHELEEIGPMSEAINIPAQSAPPAGAEPARDESKVGSEDLISHLAMVRAACGSVLCLAEHFVDRALSFRGRSSHADPHASLCFSDVWAVPASSMCRAGPDRAMEDEKRC